jgi:ABC-type nitrate/sulfonate/bicarbonate transport system ATPase subunit
MCNLKSALTVMTLLNYVKVIKQETVGQQNQHIHKHNHITQEHAAKQEQIELLPHRTVFDNTPY